MGKIIDRDIARQNLKDFYDIAHRRGINLWLVFGTLLGAFRERDLIKHDTDVDLAINHVQMGRINQMVRSGDMDRAGFRCMRNWPGLISFIRDGEFIDVYIFQPGDRGYLCRIIDDKGKHTGIFRLAWKDFTSPGKMKFLNREFKTPCDVRSYLTGVYGSDYMTPKMNAHANHFKDA